MDKTTYSITLQSVGDRASKRIDEIILQFNEWIKDKNPASMLLNFTSSEQHPMIMEEISKFFNGSPYFDVEHHIEWTYTTDNALGKDLRLEILDRTEL